MDADRFDRFSRSFGNRTSRRGAVKTLGGGGLFAAALAGLGLAKATAQDDDETCVLDLVAGVHLGPDQNRPLDGENRGELRGQLRFGIGDEGRLVDGVLRLANDDEIGVVGQVSGLAMTMRIALPEDRTLVLVGAGERALRSCEGAVDGLLMGPRPGGLGDWHAVATRAGVTATAGPATQTAAAAATMSATVGANPNPGQTPPPPGAPTTTPPPNRPPRFPTIPPALTPTHQATEPPTEPTNEPPPPPTDVPTEPPPPPPTDVPTEEPTEVQCIESGLPCTLGVIPCCSGDCVIDVIIPDVGICA